MKDKPMKNLLVKIFVTMILAGMFLPASVSAQSEAGGIFLLISPGARAGGMGEAHAAVANDAYASYWNPAGLAFLEDQEIAAMHVNWLPGLADDLYYEFLAYRNSFEGIGHFGANFTYLSLGEQIQTGNSPQEIDRFYSYMWNASVSYGYPLSQTSAIGANVKLFRQFLAPQESSSALDTLGQDGASTDFAVDLAYLNKRFLTDRLALGLVLSNMGPNISFIDENRADPPPTTFRLGLKAHVVKQDKHDLNVVYDVSKLLAARDDNGEPQPFFTAIFTSWFDDPADEEFAQLMHNFGMEYWYNRMLALRIGGFYQESGEFRTTNNLPIPTFGAGIRYQNYGFDIGYVAGDNQHPLNSTLRFSLNITF